MYYSIIWIKEQAFLLEFANVDWMMIIYCTVYAL